ncbi:hypothetical protein FIBSPDRAFT_965239 [Athelia psychrophila]|uniref:Uncharacterized protein n=1 Tax=Athelia psychrophila TaxID=1759441 RepID=A0A165WTR0_9AGAM|nr:hypothetical protein FIBSPDRAFT_965239 [Fibularhizoctonia sp. CBS 109695]
MPPRPNSGESSTAADPQAPQADIPVHTLRPRPPPPAPPKPRVKKKAPGPQAKGGRRTCKSAATVPDSPTPPESEEPQSGRASPNPREDGKVGAAVCAPPPAMTAAARQPTPPAIECIRALESSSSSSVGDVPEISAISGVLRAVLASRTEILLNSTGQPELARSKRGENSATWPDIS